MVFYGIWERKTKEPFYMYNFGILWLFIGALGEYRIARTKKASIFFRRWRLTIVATLIIDGEIPLIRITNRNSAQIEGVIPLIELKNIKFKYFPMNKRKNYAYFLLYVAQHANSRKN